MVHDGHRERLRNRFLAASESFEDHELLELLLFYAVPRKNTNELAHALLERFGTLNDVINAGIPALLGVNDMGTSSAIFFRAIAELLLRYEIAKSDIVKDSQSYAQLGKYMKSLFVGTENELTFILLFDASNKMVCCKKIAEGYSCGNVISIRQTAMEVLANNSAAAILVHNHPHGKAIPSPEDIRASHCIKTILDALGVHLIDNFIVAGGKCVPILSSEKLDLYNQ